MKSSIQKMYAPVSRSSFHILGRLLSYAFPYRARMVCALICIVIVAALSTVSITVLLPIIHLIFELEFSVPSQFELILGWLYGWVQVTASSPMMALVMVSVVFSAIVAVTGIFRYVQMYLMYWLGYRIALDLQRELFAAVSRYHMGYFARNKVGEIASYFTVDIRVINLALFNMMGKIILDPFILLFSLGLLLYLNLKLTLLYALISPLLYCVIRHFARKNRKAGRQAQDYTAGLNGLVQEHFSHIRLVQGYEMFEHQNRCFGQEAMRVFRASMSMMKALSASSPINEFLGVFATCCVLIVGGYFVLIQDELQAEVFIIYLITLGRLYQPVKRMERSIQDIQIGLAAAERVFEALDERAVLPEVSQPVVLRGFERDIVMEDVSYAYQPDAPVLREINLTVRKGEVVALVGPSGAGKTTLVNLIPRFFDPVAGAVRMDGQDLRGLELKSLRRQMALVTQEVMIMADSIRLNITCGMDGYAEEEIRAAANAAHADEFIEKLPQGYDTVIGERGVGLSGGQRQRLALARAFLRDAPILILDEATSALDSRAEAHIKASMRRLMRGRTVVVIAHRLATIQHADVIVVMDNGRIVDQGTHAELVHRCELYEKFYRLQVIRGEDSEAVPRETVS